MDMSLLLWACISAIISFHLLKIYTKFKKRGVKHFIPVPILGNMAKLALGLEHLAETMTNLYQSFPEERFIGNYEFLSPVIIIRDRQLIKKITIEDFKHFGDHQNIVDPESDPVWGKNLFSLKGEDWKNVKSLISPAFTISKMKQMIPQILEVSDQVVLKLKQTMQERNAILIDCKELFQRFGNDVMASCGFGLKINSIEVKDDQFFRFGRQASTFNLVQQFKILCYRSAPSIMKKLNIPLLQTRHRKFMDVLISDLMKSRKSTEIKRDDVLQKLIENEDLPNPTVVAQMSIFLIAVIESVSNALTFLLHELTLNPDIQSRLYAEILDDYKKNNGMEFNSVQKLPYLNMTISETLRRWSPGSAIDRVCTDDYNLGRPNDSSTEDYIIRKGEGIIIPVIGLHLDPEYFPDPLKFDPERFSEENKKNIKPYTYFPFGLGPRSCPGPNLALLMMKLMLYKLLMQFEVMPAINCYKPIKLSAENLNLRIKGGHWLKIKSRT